MASPKSITAAEIAKQKAHKEAEGLRAQAAAVAEAARVREMFAADRKRIEKRYGVISSLDMTSEVTKN